MKAALRHLEKQKQALEDRIAKAKDLLKKQARKRQQPVLPKPQYESLMPDCHGAYNHTFIDYLSFTWVPTELEPLRKLAQVHKKSFAMWLKEDAVEELQALQDAGIEESHFANWLLKPVDVDVQTKIDPVLRDECEQQIQSQQLDLSALDELCNKALRDFLTACSRGFFSGDELGAVTADMWEEAFTLNERPGGMFGYKRAYDMYVNATHIGIAASGAKNGGCFISFSGAGCGVLDMASTHRVLRGLPSLKLTRVDIAFDDHMGVFSVHDARKMAAAGKFSNGGRPAEYHYHESGRIERGKFKPCKGSSFYVGSRNAGKMLRVYEKGKQMGEPDSPWTRWEVEVRGKDREIPLDVLVKSSEFFAGSYPALAFIAQYDRVESAERIVTRRKQVTTSYKQLVKYAKNSYGGLVWVMKDRGFSDQQIIDELIRFGKIPKALKKAAGYIPAVYAQSG